MARTKEQKRQIARAYYARNAERLRQYNKEWSQAKRNARTPEQKAIDSAKSKKKRQNLTPEQRENRRRYQKQYGHNYYAALTFEQRRDNRYRWMYGIEYKEKERIFKNQGSRCAICGIHESDKWCLDHSHDDGKVRGVLCHNCNLILGHSFDDVEKLRAAIAYLEKNKVEP